MQITAQHTPVLKSNGSVSFKYNGTVVRSYGTNLEKYQPDCNRTSGMKKPGREQPDTRSSSQERHGGLRKKLLKETSRSIYSVPLQLRKSSIRGLSDDQSVSVCSQCSPGDASPASRLTPCSGSTGCTTGFSTEHSSIYSWRYDEFDRENTQHVRKLFSALDELLYEGKMSSKSETLHKECEEWNNHSPHLRILGNQLEPPKQEGIQYVHRRPTSERTVLPYSFLETKDNNHSKLCVEGHRLAPGPCSFPSVDSRLSVSEFPFSTIIQAEEIYKAEGKIEEFLAYDGKETDAEVTDQGKTSITVSLDGVPPVSPYACIRDTVSDELFDDIWQEVVGQLQELLRKHWEKQHSVGATQRWTLESSTQVLCEPLSCIASKGNQVFTSRGPNTRSVFLWPNINNGQDLNVLKINLKGVMTIQTKPLQQRQQGFTERSLCDSDDGSSTLTCLRAPQGMSVPLHKPAGQRILPRLSSRAWPRHSFPAQNTLRGTKLSTVAEDLFSKTVSAVPNHRLPVIHTESAEQYSSTPASRHTQSRGRIIRGGVAGAANIVSSLSPLREPTLLLESLSRPNTNHTYRSDTPMKSSFTPVDFALSMRNGRNVLAGNLTRTGDGAPMGVTGYSMAITSSASNGCSDSATLPKKCTNLLTSTNKEGGNSALLASIGARRTLSRFPIHGRRKFQVVMPQHT
ncbi:protein FAM149A [Trichomycterus rosablanca]|uniref:protein FAM149A n=1 Tax=Trichomycterus rosablanca TaxID=2290929 RepID=UPI002F360F14